MESFIEILKIILPALITGIFTFIVTKYNYNKNIPLDNMKIAYNGIYYPLYKIINNNKEYNENTIDDVINHISTYMNDYNIKYIDRSTHKTYIILKDNHNKYNYNNFKNNIYDRNSYLRRKLGYLEPNFIQSVMYSSKDDKFIFFCGVDGLVIYMSFMIAALFNNKGVVYKYAFVCGEVFLVIFLIKIIIKGIGILGVKIIKFGCYVKKCWNKKKC